jgi:alpha-tubulin suppressor-like RCC1 family protein
MRAPVLALLLATACVPTPAGSALGLACDLSSECDDPLVCRMGRCRRQCATLRDCPYGSRCVIDQDGLGACLLDDERTCVRASDCPEPLACTGGQCVNQCAEARDCPPGSHCIEGSCSDVEGARCEHDSQCASDGLVCGPERRCRLACLGDRDCPLGARCSEGACGAIARPVMDGGVLEDAGAGQDAGAEQDAASSVDAGGADAATQVDAGVALDGGMGDASSADAGTLDGGPGDAAAMPDAAPLPCDEGWCDEVPGGIMECVADSCVMTGCEEGFLDCDGDWRNGCEVNPEANREHCGGCGMACAPGQACLASACVTARAEQIDVGYSSACVRWSTGHVTCWGTNWDGELGHPARRVHPVPIMLPGIDDAATVVVGRSGQVCVIRRGGSLVCWGSDRDGMLGDGPGDSSDASQPVAVVGPTDAIQMSTAIGHSCAVTAVGELWCWGRNTRGELGIGSTESGPYEAPVRVTGLPTVAHVSTYPNGTCAVDVDGGLWCWGDNSESGLLGDGTEVGQAISPVQVAGLSGIAMHRTASSDRRTVVALARDGRVFCWGQNYLFAQACGLNSPARVVLTPTESPFLSAVARVSSRCAVRSDGTLWCWSGNEDGEAANGTTESPLGVPVRAEVDGVREVGAFSYFTCVLRGESEVRCAGRDQRGTLGSGFWGGPDALLFAPVVGLP